MIFIFGAFLCLLSCFILIKTRKIKEFGFLPKMIVLFVPLYLVLELANGIITGIIIHKKNVGEHVGVLGYFLFGYTQLARLVTLIFVKLMPYRFVRVQVQLKNKRENTREIMRAARWSLRFQWVFVAVSLIIFVTNSQILALIDQEKYELI